MNCQEYRDLVEDALDVSLHGEPECRALLHLEHCASCRNYFKLRSEEHIALFSGINSACEELHLPEGFADRLVASVRKRRSVRRGWRRLSLPKWVLIAASLAAMAGFVFAASLAVEALWADDSNETEVAATIPSDTYESAFTSDQPFQDIDKQIGNNQKGETEMNIKQRTAVALVAMSLAPLLSSADGNSCIISGDPVAAATANSHWAVSSGKSLETDALTAVSSSQSLEARFRTWCGSTGKALRSDDWAAGFILILR